MDNVGREMRNDNKEMDDCDKVTFVAIESEAMKAAGTEPAKPIVKKSAKKGKFRVPLPESKYHVTVEKIGFTKQEVTITVARGDSTDLNIGREKE